MNRTNIIIFVLLTILVAFGYAIFYKYEESQTPITPSVTMTPLQAVKHPIVHYRVPQTDSKISDIVGIPDKTEINESVATAPTQINQSTMEINDYNFGFALDELLNGESLYTLITREYFIQKFVVTIDNLTNEQLPSTHLPITAPNGRFLVSGTAKAPHASDANYSRYSIYVNLLGSLNPTTTIRIYTYFYPLFQTAYQQLGYKNSYFNDRLITVIDHLLETPNPTDHIQFKQPAILYTYANHDLEKLSAGQKILLRMGQKQRSEVLVILSTYRQLLTNLKP